MTWPQTQIREHTSWVLMIYFLWNLPLTHFGVFGRQRQPLTGVLANVCVRASTGNKQTNVHIIACHTSASPACNVVFPREWHVPRSNGITYLCAKPGYNLSLCQFPSISVQRSSNKINIHQWKPSHLQGVIEIMKKLSRSDSHHQP